MADGTYYDVPSDEVTRLCDLLRAQTTEESSPTNPPIVERNRGELYLEGHSGKSGKEVVYSQLGRTKIIVRIPPPQTIPSVQFYTSRAIVDVSVKFAPSATKRIDIDRVEFLLSREVKTVLDRTICRKGHENTLFDCQVVILDDDGSLLSQILNCCAYALILTGTKIRDMFATSTCAIYKGQITYDPDYHEEETIQKGGGAIVVMTHRVRNKKILQCLFRGRATQEDFDKLYEECWLRNEKQYNKLVSLAMELIEKQFQENEVQT